MKALALVFAIALSGCSSMPRVPERVEVPIQVQCKVTVPAEPAWATSTLTKDSNIFEQVRALLSERRQRIAYESQLEAAARACQ